MHKGSCHCGSIAFDVEGEPAGVIECNCTHCSRKGFLLWFVPREQFHLHAGEAALSSYRFNRHMIDHRFCPQCGCQPFATARIRKRAPTWWRSMCAAWKALTWHRWSADRSTACT